MLVGDLQSAVDRYNAAVVRLEPRTRSVKCVFQDSDVSHLRQQVIPPPRPRIRFAVPADNPS